MVADGEEKGLGCHQDKGGLPPLEAQEQEEEKEEKMIVFYHIISVTSSLFLWYIHPNTLKST